MIAKAKARQFVSDKAPGVGSMLQEGEQVVCEATVHPGIYWKGVAVFIMGLLLTMPVFNLGVFFMFVGVVMLSVAYLTQYYLLLTLTDTRLFVRRGIVHIDVVQLRLNKIESVEVQRTLPGRILGYGTILISGTGSRIAVVPFIDKAEAFRDRLNERLAAIET